MDISAGQIAKILEGTVDGNPGIMVNRLSKIEEGGANSLSFLANPVYTPHIYTTNASVVIVNKDFAPEKPVSATLIRVNDAYKGFAKLLENYNGHARNHKKGIEKFSCIDKTAKMGDGVYIGSFSYIGKNAKIGGNVQIYPNVYVAENVEIGDNTILYSGAKICSGCKIGSNCIVHMGVVIGSDGFGFTKQSTNDYHKVAQTGNVIIEDNVEIGANTTIDRATLGSTVIRKGVKLDNLIQIAHNVEIGENTVIAAQTGIAGSTKIGRECMIGGQVGIVGHIVIADKVKIAAQSGVASSITTEGETLFGSPAMNSKEFKKSYIHFKKLPELLARVKELENELKGLKQSVL